MAVAVISAIYDGAASARIEVEYTEATGDFALVRCVNGLARPVTVAIRRSTGASWWLRTVNPGQSATQNASGAVRKLVDIPQMEMRA
jgi:hypothetical protein